jgi:hypothetical protein
MVGAMTRLLPFVLFLIAAAVARADALASARTAQALLGPAVWSRVLHLENRSGTARYPIELHALVFELEERLWLYTEFDGTQSLSLYAGHLAQDKANLGPLLRAVLPELNRFTDVTDSLGPREPISQTRDSVWLPSGCFIKCVARLHALQQDASPPDEAGLLAYYVNTLSGRLGHTVLVYRQDGRRYVYDPEGTGAVFLLPKTNSNEPLALARAIYPSKQNQTPSQARMLPLRQLMTDGSEVVVTARTEEQASAAAAELPAGASLY